MTMRIVVTSDNKSENVDFLVQCVKAALYTHYDDVTLDDKDKRTILVEENE